MTDHDPATAPASDGASLMAALRELGLSDRLLKDMTDDPERAGSLLMESVADLDRTERGDQARRLLETVRDHAPAPEDRQHASVRLARLLREGRGVRDEAEAERITAELLRPGHLAEGPAQILGEDLQKLERWDEALHCHNVAARRLLAEPPEELADESDLSLAPLVSRLLARMKLGLPLDAHDDVAMAVARRQVEGALEFSGEEGGAGPEEEPEGDGPDREVEALYSREAFDEARDRGLLTGEAAEHGADAYYRAAERTLRERARKHPGARWSVVLHGVEEIAEFTERLGLGPADGETALDWAELELTEDDPRLRSWPPGRNEACWCGSDRKYKKCCGSPSNR
ncbi:MULTISPECIES: SEC-C domain-containing protein [Nocardiopsis]|uniref:Zinc-binding protein n=1 Tax=Nocardiopsis sinuspersici TaxID=501010 RepID=A0A1V3C1N3_9ACTN|nr:MULTISPECIES: SEC-C metal-binding domain-containing protein [Nocardiopsis]OOC54300.1 zinc-binding protein [Nocardiopsis sinuspersici]